MKSVVEGNNRRSACSKTGNFDGVFYSLCSTVEEDSLLGKVTRSQFSNPLGQSNIRLIHHNTKAGMGESSGLLSNSLSDFWTSMANVHSSNATCKVNVAISVYILNNSSISFSCKNIHCRTHAACNKLVPSRHQFTR